MPFEIPAGKRHAIPLPENPTCEEFVRHKVSRLEEDAKRLVQAAGIYREILVNSEYNVDMSIFRALTGYTKKIQDKAQIISQWAYFFNEEGRGYVGIDEIGEILLLQQEILRANSEQATFYLMYSGEGMPKNTREITNRITVQRIGETINSIVEAQHSESTAPKVG